MFRNEILLCLLGISACFGASTAVRRARMVGGDVAAKKQLPHAISVQACGTHIAGGAIINKRYVVTAAHTILMKDNGFPTVPIKIVAGVNDLDTAQNPVETTVAKIYVPEGYDRNARPPSNLVDDIAVLELQRDLDFKKYPNIGTINLPEGDDTYENIEAIVAGFGWNKVEVSENPETGGLVENGSSDGKLRSAKAKVLAKLNCYEKFGPLIGEQHLCAQVVQRNPDVPEGICTKDSGSPLVHEETLIGVAIFSPKGCNERVLPGIYTRVSKYVDFIKKVINGKIDESIRYGKLANQGGGCTIS